MSDRYPETPDGRYFVVRGRLWRKSDPALDEATRNRLVKDLMSARRAVSDAKGDPDAIAKARHLVDDAKVALGERGATWWEDGAPEVLPSCLTPAFRLSRRHEIAEHFPPSEGVSFSA